MAYLSLSNQTMDHSLDLQTLISTVLIMGHNGIDHLKVTARWAQANGEVERPGRE